VNKPYRVKILDAKYDEHEEMFVVVAWFEDYGEQRVIHWSKDDFLNAHGYVGNRNIPLVEMQKTATLLCNRWVQLQIEDDPNRQEMTEEEEQEVANEFRKNIGQTLENVSEGLMNPDRQLEVALKRVLDREKNFDIIQKQILGDEKDAEG